MYKYFLPGLLTGIIFVKAEIISWYRIHDMFTLESFYMYGLIGSAILTGILSVSLIKKLHLKTINKQPVTFPKKQFHKGQVIGGLIFGLGWALTGACPGPIFAQIGTGSIAFVAALISAVAGTWTYGYLRNKLPH